MDMKILSNLMNLNDNNIKSSRLEEVDIPQDLDLLNRWTIPKVDTKLIYDYGWFDKLSSKQVIKTTEQSLALNSDEQTIQLLNKRDIDLYRSRYNWMHIGMVQIAFKPLTLKGLPETFLAALRDARNLDFRQSLMGSIESTVAYGPVYFNTQPNLQLSLSDRNILDALTLNVKTHGYNYAVGSELICLSYRIYYKLLTTLNPRCKLYDSSSETILVETNFIKSKITTRRPIKWDEINFPEKWILNSAVSQRQVAEEVTNSNYSRISQDPHGKVCIEFSDNSSSSNYNSPVYSRRSFSGYRRLPEIQHISPLSNEGPSYGSARRRPLSLHTLSDTLSEGMVERVRIDPKTNIVQATDRLSDLDPTQSEMDFSVDKATDLNDI